MTASVRPPYHHTKTWLLDILIDELSDALERHVALPAHWYTDPAILEIEKRTVFPHTWHYVGHTDRIHEDGTFFTTMIGTVPIVIVRVGGKLRGYVNVCRHRSHVVAHGEGTCSSFQCRYHGWTWDLEGKLLGAPRADHEQEFDISLYPLIPTRVSRWGSLIFVSQDVNGPSLDEVLGELPHHAIAHGHDPTAFQLTRREEMVLPCNWKVVMDNMIECYHCPTSHPTFRDVYDLRPEVSTIELHDQCAYVAASLKRTPAAQARRDVLGDWQMYCIYPTTVIAFHGSIRLVAVAVPVTAEETRVTVEYHAHATVDADHMREFEEFYAPVWREDLELVASVQIGHRSNAVPAGPLLGNADSVVRNVQRLLRMSFVEERDRVARGREYAHDSFPVGDDERSMI